MTYTYSQIPWLLCFVLIALVFYLYLRLSQNVPVIKTNKSRKNMSAQEALDMLLQGNNEYIQSGTSEFDRKSVAHSQHPCAIILSCSDSRVSPELIFNQLHVGNLFIVRNAGNILDEMVLGSIEYGVKYLASPLIIVLGHDRCEAIKATVESILENQIECSSHIKHIINIMKPTAQDIIDDMKIETAITVETKNEIIKKTSFANIHRVISKISKNSPIISQALQENKIKLVGAYYDLDHGNLRFID